MDSFGNLKLKWAYGYNGSELQFIDNQTLVYNCSNILTFVDKTGKHVKSIPSVGRGIGSFAVCQELGLVAYAENSLEPLIHVLKYPECSIHLSLKGDAKLKYQSLAFSSDGSKLVSLSGIPDFLLTVWNLEDGMMICQKSVGVTSEDSVVLFNPLTWKQLSVIGQQKTTFWTVESCDTFTILTSINIKLPEKDTPVGNLVQSTPQQEPKVDNDLKKQENSMGVVIPDMTKVYYQQSYDEYTRKLNTVVPTSHCWTNQATIYIGCQGGQLLLTDFESGTTKVLANPAILQNASDYDINEETSLPHKESGSSETGHAILCEDALQCLALTQRGLFVGGKDGHVYCLEQSNELRIIDTCKLPYAVTTMTWSSEYDCITVGTDQGCIYVLDPNNLTQHSITSEHFNSPFVGIDMLSPGTTHCITCRRNGIVQVWDAIDGILVSTINLSTQCTADGSINVLSAVDPKGPKLVMREKLYNTPIALLKSDVCGRFLVITSISGSVFICSSYPTQGLAILGHTVVEGDIVDVSILPVAWELSSITKIAVLNMFNNSSSITVFSIPNKLSESAIDELYDNPTRLFNDDTVMKHQIVLSEVVLSLVLAPNNCTFVVPKKSKTLYKLPLPSSEEKISEVLLSSLAPLTNHELPGGCYGLSFHQRWFRSVGPDGKLMLRLVEAPDRIVCGTPHHYKTGGGRDIVLGIDGQTIITIGDNCTITCWKWELTNHGKTKLSSATEYAQAKLKVLSKIIETQNTALEKMPDIKENEESKERTWLERTIEETHVTEDEKYAKQKTDLREEIAALREKVLSMIATNEQVPDIERLERAEFILDTEEHIRHREEEEKQIAAVKEEIELSNLAKMYLRDLIKRQCWDAMSTKGRVVKAFKSRLEVSNYPMKSQSEDEIKELERVQSLRKIEISERNVRMEVASTLRQTMRISIAPDELGLDEEDKKVKDVETSEPHALVGSRSEEYGGWSDLFYDQFELLSTVSKKHQIVLLKESLRNIKEVFNKEFNEVLRMKEVEIGRIQEKNLRINKIAHDLKVDEKLVKPSLDAEEQPERVLSVQDEEVTVEKYMSDEVQKKMEEKAKEDEERKLKEMADNWRERALDLMMAGRLEANAEEDLFKDLARPDFMNKDLTELTEDEIRLKHDFEKKEAAFLEEREKLKRALEAEMNKNQETIQQIMDSFDERIMKLFRLKLRTEMTVQQEELKILRLSASLLVEEEVRMREEHLENKLNEKKSAKIKLSNLLSQTKRQVEGVQEEYDQLVMEDKELDRAFKKDFADCEPFVDQLYKLFRRRLRGHKLKGGGDIGTSMSVGARPSSGSVLHLRKSSIVTMGSVTHGVGRVEAMMADLDDPVHMPEGLEQTQWDRFITARHKKVESELRVKTKALKLAEMNDFLHKREEEDAESQHEIQETYKDLSNLHDDKALFDMDPEIQFLLRQGQVEVDTGDYVPDFKDSVLIHRSGIEELNSLIKNLGDVKLANMTECKDFKKGIRMLEWELKRLHMEAEDLVIKAKDVQMLRVTKELQERLMMDNIQSKDQNQIETLEKTIELNKKTSHRRISRQKKHLNDLKEESKRKKDQNMELDVQLKEMTVEVMERQNVQNLAGPLPSELNAEARMKEIVSRRRLVELAKAQAKEVGVLREEVERLRMRTFPALVQVENI